MYRRLFYLIAAVLLATAFAAPVLAGDSGGLSLRSSAFSAGSTIPRRFSCQGEGVSPPLSWSGVPDKAKSLALIVDDPDAPSGTFVHWVVYNLAPSTSRLGQGASGQLPSGAATAANGAQEHNYHGMCPPSGTHRYRFKLYALDTKLAQGQENKASVRAAMRGHVLAHTELVATYSKR